MNLEWIFPWILDGFGLFQRKLSPNPDLVRIQAGASRTIWNPTSGWQGLARTQKKLLAQKVAHGWSFKVKDLKSESLRKCHQPKISQAFWLLGSIEPNCHHWARTRHPRDIFTLAPISWHRWSFPSCSACSFLRSGTHHACHFSSRSGGISDNKKARDAHILTNHFQCQTSPRWFWFISTWRCQDDHVLDYQNEDGLSVEPRRLLNRKVSCPTFGKGWRLPMRKHL